MAVQNKDRNEQSNIMVLHFMLDQIISVTLKLSIAKIACKNPLESLVYLTYMALYVQISEKIVSH